MNLLPKFKQTFDQEINNYLDEKIKWAKSIDERGSLLIEIIKEFINRGGKKLRPALFYYSYCSYSKKALEETLKFSFLFELFQTFALIHDDIIDNSDLRRGAPSIHKKYDLSTAILSGDVALALTNEIFINQLNKFETDKKTDKKIKNLFNEFQQEIAVGQYLDYLKINDIDKIMELKSARYSFIKPATIGLYLAGLNDFQVIKWVQVIREVGMLFQIQDDYLGTFSFKKTIGKPITSDFNQGKNTLIIKFFKKSAGRDEINKFSQIFAKGKVSQEDFNWYIKKLKEKKIDKKIQKLITTQCNFALKYLEDNFGQILLSDFLKEILFKIKDTSFV